MTYDDAIISWIDNLPAPNVSSLVAATPPPDVAAVAVTTACDNNRRTRKRKRRPPTTTSRHLRRLPSPAATSSRSASALEMADDRDRIIVDLTPRDPKRFRPTAESINHPDPDPDPDLDLDLDPTPKSNRTEPQPPPAASRASSSLASSSIASYASDFSLGSGPGTPTKKRRRQSSPRKQVGLRAMEKAVESVSFDGEAELPAKLDDVLSRVEDLARGNGIISHTCKELLYQQRATSRRFRWVKESSFAPPPPPPTTDQAQSRSSRDELGPTPTIETVNKIWTNADEHLIHADYTRSAKVSHHNKVDFCVFVKQRCPELTRAALTSPFQSVNHIEYPALLERPIALSIETKVTGQDWAEAVNQMSVWLLAQWDALDDLVSRTRSRAAAPAPAGGSAAAAAAAAAAASPAVDSGAPNLDSSNANGPKPSAAAVAGLVFLPGIVMQGYDWYFVAMTRSVRGHLQLYSRILCGSTQNTEGIYQVVAVLQLLARYIKNEYWPWFKQTIFTNV